MRPEPDEYPAPFQHYVESVAGEDVLALHAAQPGQARALLGALTPDRAAHRYAEGKWSVEEVLGHVLDIEWVLTNRVVRIARGDTTPLPGVEESVLMAGADFTGQLPQLLDQLEALRAASGLAFGALSDDAWRRRGTAADSPFSARALLCFLVGHARHHLGVLEERYL